MKKFLLLMAAVLLSGLAAEAQILERLGKRVKRKVEDRIEQKTDEAVDKGLDKVEEAAEGKDGEHTGAGMPGAGESEEGSALETAAGAGEEVPGFNVYSKFDFLPGDKILF